MTPYFEGGGVTLYLGDARVLAAEHGPVDCVVTDPRWCSRQGRLFHAQG